MEALLTVLLEKLWVSNLLVVRKKEKEKNEVNLFSQRLYMTTQKKIVTFAACQLGLLQVSS